MKGTFGALLKELISAARREGIEVEVRIVGVDRSGPVAHSFEEAEWLGMFGGRRDDDPGPSGVPRGGGGAPGPPSGSRAPA